MHCSCALFVSSSRRRRREADFSTFLPLPVCPHTTLPTGVLEYWRTLSHLSFAYSASIITTSNNSPTKVYTIRVPGHDSTAVTAIAHQLASNNLRCADAVFRHYITWPFVPTCRRYSPVSRPVWLERTAPAPTVLGCSDCRETVKYHDIWLTARV